MSWNVAMSIFTGKGKEEGTFAVLNLSTFKFHDPVSQMWLQLDTDPLDPGRLQYIVEGLGDRHTLTISKSSDIISPMLVKAYHRKSHLPTCALHLAWKQVLDHPSILDSIAGLYDYTLVMTHVSVKRLETYTHMSVNGDVSNIEYITFKVRGTYKFGGV